MKKLIALLLILALAAPCLATITPTIKGKMNTNRGMMIWGTFTGLGATTAGSTAMIIPGINSITSLSTWAASAVPTSGATALITVSGHTMYISQEVTSAANPSSGYFWVIGK